MKTTNENRRWKIRGLGRLFAGAVLSVAATGVGAQDSLFIDSLGQLGVGTSTPGEALHLFRDDGTARLLVEETNDVVARRNLVDLENNGPAGFVLRDADTGLATEFTMIGSNGDFSLNFFGTGAADLRFGRNGALLVQPGGQQTLGLSPSGDMSIAGTLVQGSSRATKTAIKEVDPKNVLTKLAKLPLMEWQYRWGQSRHVGPMAEEFYTLYGLGPDDKHIAPNDLAGVALAAAQALHRKTEEQQELLQKQAARLDAQRTEIEELKTSLANAAQRSHGLTVLERRLEKLEAYFPDQRVALK